MEAFKKDRDIVITAEGLKKAMARFGHTQHRTGIRAMGGDGRTIQLHISQKALVAAQKTGADQGAVELHLPKITQTRPIGNAAMLR